MITFTDKYNYTAEDTAGFFRVLTNEQDLASSYWWFNEDLAYVKVAQDIIKSKFGKSADEVIMDCWQQLETGSITIPEPFDK